jgi:hypothetical protein
MSKINGATVEYGIVSLLPTALVLVLAIITRRTLESVVAGALFAFFLMDGSGFIATMAVVSKTSLGSSLCVDFTGLLLRCSFAVEAPQRLVICCSHASPQNAKAY